MTERKIKENEGSFCNMVFLLESIGGGSGRNTSSNNNDKFKDMQHKMLGYKDTPIEISGIFDENEKDYYITENDLFSHFSEKSGMLNISGRFKMNAICRSLNWKKEGNLYRFNASFVKAGKISFVGKVIDPKTKAENTNKNIKNLAEKNLNNTLKKINPKNLVDAVKDAMNFLDKCIKTVAKAIEIAMIPFQIANAIAGNIQSSIASAFEVVGLINNLRNNITNFVNSPFKIVAMLNSVLDAFKKASIKSDDLFMTSKNTRKFLMNSYESVTNIGGPQQIVEGEFLTYMATLAVANETEYLIKTIYDRDQSLSDESFKAQSSEYDNSEDGMPLLNNDTLLTLDDIISSRDDLINAIQEVISHVSGESTELINALSDLIILLQTYIPNDSGTFPNIEYIENNRSTNPLSICYEYYGNLEMEQIICMRNNLYDELIVDNKHIEVLRNA